MADTNISNKAAKKATGKDWQDWFGILDEENSTGKTHKEIAAWLSDNFDISGWWCQMVTVQYERERGMREVHEKADGFEAGKSKTYQFHVSKLFEAWIKPEARKQWLETPEFEIRTSTENKSIRITWPDETNVSVYFYPKSDNKTQISVQHNKLENREDVTQRKAYWQVQLTKLNAFLQN